MGSARQARRAGGARARGGELAYSPAGFYLLEEERMKRQRKGQVQAVPLPGGWSLHL